MNWLLSVHYSFWIANIFFPPSFFIFLFGMKGII